MKLRVFGAAAGLLVVSAANAGDIYTDVDSFVEAVGWNGISINSFDGVGFGPQPPLDYDDFRGFLYIISSPGGLFCNTGEVSTAHAGDAIFIDFTDCPPTAVGGYFWVRDADFNLIPGQITLVYSDGTEDVFASAAKDTFRGYVSGGVEMPRVRVLAVADGGLEGWAAMDELYLAYPCHGVCYVDCDANGSLDLFDFLCFANAFQSC